MIIGWMVGVEPLTRLAPSFPYTMPLPAMLVAAIGLDRRAANPRSWLGRLAAIVVTFEGARALLSYIAGVPTPVLYLIAPASAAALAARLPPLPAPNTAVGILTIGVAILTLDEQPWRGVYISELTAGAAGLIALVALVGHADGAMNLGTVSASPAMALPTALCLLVLSIGVFAARPGRGVTSILARDGLGSAAATRLIVLVCTAPLLFGWVTLMAHRSGLIDASAAAALTAVATVLASAGAIAWTAHAIDRVDAERRQVDAERERGNATAASMARFRTMFENAAVALVEQDVGPLLKRAAEFRTLDAAAPEALAKQRGLIESMLRAAVVVHANPAALRLFEAPSTEALRAAWNHTPLPEQVELFVRATRAIADGAEKFEAEVPILTLRGTRRDVLVSIAAPQPPTFETVLTGFVDLTERKHAQAVLVEARRARENAARAAVEADRRRVARELHDGVVQELTALKLLLEREAREHPRDALALAVRRTSAMLGELRAVVDDLRPHDLIHDSLQGAIATQARLLTAERAIAVTCDLQADVRLAQWAVRDVYRIAQEAMANAVRHGSPRQLAVRLWQRDGETGLEIEDDGQGFETHAVQGGSGLQNMRERASTLAADLTIDSRSGGGTRVRLLVGPDAPVTPVRG